jgi:hypothetical protein
LAVVTWHGVGVAASLVLPAGVGDVAAVSCGGRLAFVMWHHCPVVVVVSGGSCRHSSVSTPISPHEQWLVGWVVVLWVGS